MANFTIHRAQALRLAKRRSRWAPGCRQADRKHPQTLYSDGFSTSAFFFADLSPSVTGVDTLYAAGDPSGNGALHKYAKTACGGAADCYMDTGQHDGSLGCRMEAGHSTALNRLPLP